MNFLLIVFDCLKMNTFVEMKGENWYLIIGIENNWISHRYNRKMNDKIFLFAVTKGSKYSTNIKCWFMEWLDLWNEIGSSINKNEIENWIISNILMTEICFDCFKLLQWMPLRYYWIKIMIEKIWALTHKRKSILNQNGSNFIDLGQLRKAFISSI